MLKVSLLGLDSIGDNGIFSLISLYLVTARSENMDFLIGFIFVLGITGFTLFIADMIAAICNDYSGG